MNLKKFANSTKITPFKNHLDLYGLRSITVVAIVLIPTCTYQSCTNMQLLLDCQSTNGQGYAYNK